jgi:hypothetical protein
MQFLIPSQKIKLSYIQSVSWLVDINVEDDFIGFCDQKITQTPAQFLTVMELCPPET